MCDCQVFCAKNYKIRQPDCINQKKQKPPCGASALEILSVNCLYHRRTMLFSAHFEIISSDHTEDCTSPM